jgi:hypothetical protein
LSAEAFSNGWLPRPYQSDVRAEFARGINRHLLIWHRRAGKDATALNIADEKRRDEVGTYWHMFPLHTQAKNAIWFGIGKDGQRFIDQAFPPDERVATRQVDMQIEFKNGSIWQMCGSDRYDSLVGSNVRGVIFSEWALCDPRAWDYIRPIIRENGGWVMFITTYRGRNHAYRMAQRLADNPDWNVNILSVDDTTDRDGRRILTPADIQAERDEDMSEALIQQEYYCNPMAAIEGAVYGRAFEQLVGHERAGAYAFEPGRKVTAAWSLEYDDQYTVAFFQGSGNESRIVGSKSIQFAGMTESLDAIDGAYPWDDVRHIVPPDTSSDVIELFERRGEIVEPAPDLDAVTMLTRERLGLTMIDNVPRPWTDGEPNNELVIDALNGYHYPKTKTGAFSPIPANTWERHYARALEVYALWRHHEPDNSSEGWHPAPSTEQRDRAVI